MYVFAVYASCAHLDNLWTNMCGLVSRRSMCFWDCRSMHVQWENTLMALILSEPTGSWSGDPKTCWGFQSFRQPLPRLKQEHGFSATWDYFRTVTNLDEFVLSFLLLFHCSWQVEGCTEGWKQRLHSRQLCKCRSDVTFFKSSIIAIKQERIRTDGLSKSM